MITALWLMIIETSQKAEYIEWFLTDVLLFTHLVHLPAAYASKTYPMNIRFAQFQWYQPKARFGEWFEEQFGEHLKNIWCVIAAVGRYGIGRDDDESKLA